MTPHDTDTMLTAGWREASSAAPAATPARIVEASAPERASRVAVLAELEDLRLSCLEMRGVMEDRYAAGIDAAGLRATSRWTVRDVVAHLASWAMETRREAEFLIAGTPFDYTIHFEREGGPRTWNQREVDARAPRTLTELFEELDRETIRTADLIVEAPQETFDAVATLPRTSGEPAAAWQMPLGAMVLGTCWHARLHLRALERVWSG